MIDLRTGSPFATAVYKAASDGTSFAEAALLLHDAERRHGISIYPYLSTDTPMLAVLSDAELSSRLLPFFHETHLVISGEATEEIRVVFDDKFEDEALSSRTWSWNLALWANIEFPGTEAPVWPWKTTWGFPQFLMESLIETQFLDYSLLSAGFRQAIDEKTKMFPRNQQG